MRNKFIVEVDTSIQHSKVIELFRCFDAKSAINFLATGVYLVFTVLSEDQINSFRGINKIDTVSSRLVIIDGYNHTDEELQFVSDWVKKETKTQAETVTPRDRTSR
jgi:hypothetical protein